MTRTNGKELFNDKITEWTWLCIVKSLCAAKSGVAWASPLPTLPHEVYILKAVDFGSIHIVAESYKPGTQLCEQSIL